MTDMTKGLLAKLAMFILTLGVVAVGFNSYILEKNLSEEIEQLRDAIHETTIDSIEGDIADIQFVMSNIESMKDTLLTRIDIKNNGQDLVTKAMKIELLERIEEIWNYLAIKLP